MYILRKQVEEEFAEKSAFECGSRVGTLLGANGQRQVKTKSQQVYRQIISQQNQHHAAAKEK